MRALRTLAAGLLLAGSAAAQPSYEVVIDEDFSSDVNVEQVLARAQQVSNRAIQIRQQELGLEVVVPPPAVIHAVYGCRGEDLGKMDPRIGAVQDEWVWAVVMTGNFSLRRYGTFPNTEGFVLIHPVSGLPFRTGFFAGKLEDRL